MADETLTLSDVIASMRNFAEVADSCEVTQGHMPTAIRSWIEMLEALPVAQPQAEQQSAGGALTDNVIDKRLNRLYRHLLGSGQHNGGMSGVAWDRAVYRSALAARQPVGEPVFFVEDDFGLWKKTDAGNYGFWEKSGTLKVMKLYTAPPAPAQGVDLALIRRDVERLKLNPSEGDVVYRAGFNGAIGCVVSLLDGKAVLNG